MSAGDGGAPAGPPAWAKPGPAGALTLAAFFDGVREGRLVVQRCLTCRALAVPPKAVCQECEAISWEPAPLGGEGEVTSFTVIRIPPRGRAAEAPYAIALVKLDEGLSILGRVVEIPLDALATGLPVRFRPVVSQNQTLIGFGAP